MIWFILIAVALIIGYIYVEKQNTIKYHADMIEYVKSLDFNDEDFYRTVEAGYFDDELMKYCKRKINWTLYCKYYNVETHDLLRNILSLDIQALRENVHHTDETKTSPEAVKDYLVNVDAVEAMREFIVYQRDKFNI